MEIKWSFPVLRNASHGPFWSLFQLSLLLTLLLTTLNLSLVSGEHRPKAYLRPEQCRRSEYFDVLSLHCVSCATLAENTFATNQSALLESSATDRTVCSCHSGLRLDQSEGKFHCVNHTCAENQVLLENECGICEQSASATNTGACQCPLGSLLRKVIIEDVATNSSSVHFRCSPYQLSMGLESAPCHLSYLLTTGSSCQCPRENYVEEDGQCLPQRTLVSADTRLQFGTIRFRTDRFVSQHLYRSLRPAVYNCNNLKNQSACHHLLNLCTLKLATELSSLESGEEKWNLCLYLNHLNPTLDFQVDTYYASELQENVVPDQFHAGDTVQIVATTFAHDGHFQQMSTLRLNDLFLCHSAKLTHDHISFGTNLHKKCSWKTAELWELASKPANNHFWDLHLLSAASKLYPVPVRVSFGEQIATRWMVKRFFLLNSQIGVDLKRFNTQGVSRFVLYPRSVSLQITLSQHSSRGQIYPPVVKVQYEAIDAGEASRHSHTTETEFSVVFQMNDSTVKYHLNLAISILTTFAVFWSIFRTWCWMKRTDSGLDASAVFTFLATVINAVSNTLLLVSLFFVINQLVVFKFQSVIHTVLFTPEQEGLIVVYLVVAYILKTIQLFREIICTTSIDIFFLDWEKPRNKEILESNGKMEYKSRMSSSDSKLRTELTMEMTNTRKPQSGVSNFSSSSSEASSSVTIWRSCFVANEWSELNGKRRIDPCLHIFLLILLLECTDLKSFSRVMPYADVSSSSDEALEEVPESSTARLALISTFYILLASIQYLYKKFILENLGWGKLNQFIDLCSVSNISVFCLKYKRFGYYLHGLSPNGRSDVNMLEMYNLLEMEESDLCSKRGLAPNTEQQTFEMYLPSVLHDHWSSLRRPIDRSSPGNPFPPQLNTDLRNVDKTKLVQAYTSINRFLCSFIEHSFVKADYIVQDRSGFESLFNFEQDSSQQKGRFYNDNGHSFESVLLYGIELTLATFELLTFIMVDLIYRNYILSAVITFFISKILTVIYIKMSRKNLVHKTLMDERFLI